jgi:hypothetical protein
MPAFPLEDGQADIRLGPLGEPLAPSGRGRGRRQTDPVSEAQGAWPDAVWRGW